MAWIEVREVTATWRFIALAATVLSACTPESRGSDLGFPIILSGRLRSAKPALEGVTIEAARRWAKDNYPQLLEILNDGAIVEEDGNEMKIDALVVVPGLVEKKDASSSEGLLVRLKMRGADGSRKEWDGELSRGLLGWSVRTGIIRK